MSVDPKATSEMAEIMALLAAKSQDGMEAGDVVSAALNEVMAPAAQMADLPMYGGDGFDPNMGYDPSEGYSPYSTETYSTVSRPPVSSAETDSMKRFMMALAENDAPAAPSHVNDRVLAEAVVTERTPNGTRIGSWEIVIKEGRTAKTYDVVSEDGEVVIARDLYLYDAAHGIARSLNDGVAINDPKVRKLLALEEGFAKKTNDATVYRERAKKATERGDTFRAAVAEDRHDEASSQALSMHNEILRLAGLLRP